MAAYTPKFLGDGLYDTDINFELEGEMGGSIHYECTYTRQGQTGTLKHQNIICTGIRGMAYVKIEIEADKKDSEKKKWRIGKNKKITFEKGKKTKKDDTPIQEKYNGEYTELLAGFTIAFDPEPVFDDSLKKHFN